MLSDPASVYRHWRCKLSAVSTTVLAKQIDNEMIDGEKVMQLLIDLLLFYLWSMISREPDCFPALAHG